MSTAVQLRQTFARTVGPFLAKTTDSAGTTTTLVCSDLVDTDLPPSRLNRAWVLVTSGAMAGFQRQVSEQGLDNTTGEITVSSAFPVAIPSGVTFELHFRVPAKNTLDQDGCLEAIGEALQRMRCIDMLPMTGVTDQTTYTLDLTTFWWLTDKRWILDVFDPPASGSDEPIRVDKRFRFRMDWESIYLDFDGAPWKTGDTGYLQVRRPANSRLKLTATATAAIAGGVVTGVTVTAPGYYTSTPTVTGSGGGGTGAVYTATLSGTGVASIAVSGSMSGYTSRPTLTVSAGSWGDMTSEIANLVGDTDEITPAAPVRDVVAVARWIMYQRLSEASGATLPEGWAQKEKEWAVAARKVLSRNQQRDEREGLPRLQPVYAGIPVRSR